MIKIIDADILFFVDAQYNKSIVMEELGAKLRREFRKGVSSLDGQQKGGVFGSVHPASHFIEKR